MCATVDALPVAVVRANSRENTTRLMPIARLEREGDWLVRGQVLAASLFVLLAAVSLVVYLPGGTGLAIATAALAIGSLLLVVRLLVRMHSPRLALRVWRGKVVAGSMASGEYFRAADRRLRAWGSGCAACLVAVFVAAAIGGSGSFPITDARQVRPGTYTEVDHGKVLGPLSQQEFERIRMANLRFFVAISVAFLVAGALVTSGALRVELPRERVRRRQAAP